MRRIQSSSLLLALAVALVPLACSQETPTDTGSQKAEASAVPKTAEVEPGKLGKGKGRGMGDKMGRRGKGKFGRDRGPAAKLLSTALSDLELSAEQKEKISALKPEKGERKGDKGEGREAMQKALSEAVKTGKVDAKIFETQMASMKVQHEAKQAAQAKLLNDLHAALEPAQRTALVAKVKEKNAERAKQMEAMHAKWAEKAKAGGEDDAKGEDGDDGKGKRGMGMRGGKGMRGGHGGKMGMGFAHFAKGLELTDAQQKQVDALQEKLKADKAERPDMKKMHAEMETRTNALLDAFAKDGFDATKLELGPAKKEAPKFADHVTRMNEFLAILTADQRGKLAERIANPPKRGVPKGMEMKKGMRGGDQPAADDGDDFGLPDLDDELDEMEDDVVGDEAAE